jgi:hypothetical protein
MVGDNLMTYPLISAAEQLIYITNIEGWTNALLSFPVTRRSTVERPIYALDMYNNANDKCIYKYIKPYMAGTNRALWNEMWLTDFKDNAGSNVYQALESVFPVNIYNQPVASRNIYTSDFSLSPLIPMFKTDESGDDYSLISPTWAAESLIWQASVFPLYPLLLGGTIREHRHYGPVFITKIVFSSSGQKALGEVDINIKLEGSKIFTSPFFANDLNYASVYERGYRKSKFSDCLLLSEAVDNTSSLAEKAPNSWTIDVAKDVRIVEIGLDIEQKIEFIFPCSSMRSDSKGPRFASLTSRTVNGHVVFYSKEQYIDIPEVNELTLYFGGPFLFSMPNIQWQQPELVIEVKSGYIHTYNFIAKAATNAIAEGFKGNGEYPISEFTAIPGFE